MDTFETLSVARQSGALSDKVALLDHMQSIFSELHDRFPKNATFSRQLDAIRSAHSKLQPLVDLPEYTKGELEAVFDEVLQVFRDAGAKETDLKQWGL